MCLRFLDFVEDPCHPIKRELLIDLCELLRTTGNAIATALTQSLKKDKVDIANCRGQDNDTTSSMSSSKKGVQAEIAKCAPNADYQGCYLHALNLAICNKTHDGQLHAVNCTFFSTTLQKGNVQFWISLLKSREKVRP